MSILSHDTLKALLASGWLVTNPIPGSIQPASIDLTLAEDFLFHEDDEGPIEFGNSCPMREVKAGWFLVLPPLTFVLASTREYLRFPPWISGQISGKSSNGRRGLFIENAGFFDPGFEGTATLELFNATNRPMHLRPGMKIAQMVFSALDRPASVAYGDPSLGSKYHGQLGVTASLPEGDRVAWAR